MLGRQGDRDKAKRK